MRIQSLLTAGVLAAISVLAACDRKSEGPSEAPTARTQALLSDELPGLSAPATGIAFWEHPTLPFNSLLIVANENGVTSYDMENGAEVSRIDGFNAAGAEVSYIGLGPQAAGLLAFFDEADSLFRFHGIDNASRAFLPLDPGPEIRGVVRDFCMGRAKGTSAPTLFVVQNAKIQLFNLFANAQGVAVESNAVIDTPDNLTNCAVDQDGVVILAAEDGAIYRLANDEAFTTPFAKAATTTTGDIAIIASEPGAEDQTATSGQILLLDQNDGALHIFDLTDGSALGIIDFAGTDQMPDAGPATLMSAESANLGALYRDGVVAMGALGEEGPVIRIAPLNSLLNALSLPVGNPVSPRGAVPEQDDGLIISTPDISNQPE